MANSSLVTRQAVTKYILQGKGTAGNELERSILETAKWLNSLESGGIEAKTPRQRIYAKDTGDPRIHSIKARILHEIDAALCKNAAKYKTEMAVFKQHIYILIGAIATTVAQHFAVAVVVVTALVAALLRLVLKMGISVFCAGRPKR